MLLFLISSTRVTSMSLPLSVATGYAIEKNPFCTSSLFRFCWVLSEVFEGSAFMGCFWIFEFSRFVMQR